MGNMHIESKSMVSEDTVCVAEVPEVSIACIPVLDSACQNSSLPDNMTIDEVHNAFVTYFGMNTITDKQWLNLNSPPSLIWFAECCCSCK